MRGRIVTVMTVVVVRIGRFVFVRGDITFIHQLYQKIQKIVSGYVVVFSVIHRLPESVDEKIGQTFIHDGN